MIRLTLLLILAVGTQVHAQAGKLMVADPPKPATVEGYEQGHCVALRNRIRICKVLSESDALLVVEKDGKTVGTWPVDASLGETKSFYVMHGDLDGDRKPELIVANLDSTSVGISVSVWTIAIFPDSEFPDFQPPLTFRIKEFGTRGTFVFSGGRTNILTTDWRYGTDPKGRRGEGLYLVGQWWRYQHGQLLALPKRILARRFLLSFQNERFNTWESDRVPYQWFLNRHTDLVANDFITGPTNSSRSGVIESVTVNKEGSSQQSIRIAFKPNNGEVIDFIYADRNENDISIDRFLGDTVSGTVYPDYYLPPDLKKWLTGRRATLRTYVDRKGEILWLEPTK